MSRPRIGITTDYVKEKPHYMLPWTYAQAVEKAGGLPFMLPYKCSATLAGQFVDTLDGVVLSGGDDLNPAAYDQEKHLMTGLVDPDRQAFEFALLAEVERRAVPVLGVCLGCQVMNVHRGGSLHQFLPDLDRTDPLEHRRIGDNWAFRHDVTVEPNSLLAQVLGTTRIESNSSHKQSIDAVGKGLRVVAHAPDGVVEAAEDPSFPFYLGVQWHPERQNDEAVQLHLFERLVRAASTYASSR